MWIVRLALNRPYTFMVAALLILVLGDVLRRTRTSRLESLQLAQSLFKGGLVTETDITQA
ncbi:hypothetical protein [Spirosoma areae]